MITTGSPVASAVSGPATADTNAILASTQAVRADQKAALALADLLVLPSLNESFGNSAAEAVAAGVPVLLTDTCGIASMIHRRAGLAVPLGVEALAEGLRQIWRFSEDDAAIR